MEDNTNPNLDGQEPEDDGITIDAGEEEPTEVEDAEDSESGEQTSDAEGKDDEEPKEKINQEAVNKKINKLYSEKKQAEEKAAQETARRVELEAKLNELTKTKLPDIPPLPDVLDHEYTKKLQERDAIIRQHGAAEHEQKLLEDDKKAAVQAEFETDQKYVKTIIEKFDNIATTLKLDKSSVEKGSAIVGAALPGKTALARFLLEADDGPLNVLYLANSDNAEELDKISKMSEVQAAVYIATVVAPKAASLKPKQSSTPEPHYTPRGRAKNVAEYSNLEGATFE